MVMNDIINLMYKLFLFQKNKVIIKNKKQHNMTQYIMLLLLCLKSIKKFLEKIILWIFYKYFQ